MRFAKGNLYGGRLLVVGALFLLPLLLGAAKLYPWSGASMFQRIFSLGALPDVLQHRLLYVLFIPMGALLVVFCRLTLGIRILGPFRSILIAIAFQITGILHGLVFLIIVTLAIVLLRPRLKAVRLPYFARVSVLLSVVSLIIAFTVLSGRWIGSESLVLVGYFPIIVLALIGEGFSRTLTREGWRSALWRGTMTVLVAVIITLIAGIDALQGFQLDFPEFLLIEVGLILVISEYLDLRLLRVLNPPPRSGQSRKKKTKYVRVLT